jgi:hypothetical protein
MYERVKTDLTQHLEQGVRPGTLTLAA